MLIARITGLHIAGEDRLCQGRVAKHAQLQKAVAHINSLDHLHAPSPFFTMGGRHFHPGGILSDRRYRSLPRILWKISQVGKICRLWDY